MRVESITPINYGDLIQPGQIHGALYTDPGIYEQELDRIFHKGWVFVAHESEVPHPGDYVTRTVGRQSYIVARDKSGTVQVLLNRCQHRGNLLCNRPHGKAKVLTCPYHGWTYGLDGQVLDIPYAGGFNRPWEEMALERPRHDSYRGFLFASLDPDGITLAEHLGLATELIDRSCDRSPQGEIGLRAGWLRHRYYANWKMLPENDTDGYHVNFTHQSFMRAIESQYDHFVSDEASVKGLIRDWGNGHTEIDFAPGYREPLDWLGTSPDKVRAWVDSLEQAYGKTRAEEIMWRGPPHACIWPNLFLGEMNIVIFQPLGVSESVQWHSPMFLKGAPELDYRLLRQSEGALGAASFLVAEDCSIAERTQQALDSGQPWLDLSRGLEREEQDARGVRVSHMSDETSNRGFWRHYEQVMTA